ncbi:hypothetical protein RR48_12792 [Papilio machaon]|uniref:Uncharacterized protein n=1 Tax=Papilio machaon TaxID=76193 RepID=A0A194QSJ1_PAPMA|nr:hypothetical protein RR48_12792 [Papilio machaon]
MIPDKRRHIRLALYDPDNELLEKRIKQLEAQLEEEKRRTQRERMAVTKLQNKLIKLKGLRRLIENHLALQI